MQNLITDQDLQTQPAQERLSEKERKWTDVIHAAALTSPPGTRTIIATRMIGATAFVAMIPFHPEWFVYGIWAAVMVISEWCLAFLARREFQNPKSAADT